MLQFALAVSGTRSRLWLFISSLKKWKKMILLPVIVLKAVVPNLDFFRLTKEVGKYL